VLAHQVVRYAGEAVAAIVAGSLAAARSAAELIEAEFEELPAVTDGKRALVSGAPAVHPETGATNLCLDSALGSDNATAEALSTAPHVVELEVRNNRVAVCQIEMKSLKQDRLWPSKNWQNQISAPRSSRGVAKL
jgi:carbon-monoxide dehydrogenase large subunit